MKLKGLAGVSGIPEVEREVEDSFLPLFARIYTKLEPGRYIIALIDDPFVVVALDYGEIVDFSCSTESGAFSLRTCGELPTADFVKLASSDPYSWRKKILTEGGLFSYLSTDSIDEAVRKNHLIIEAMVYQMAKEIWGMATVFCGDFKEILLTGKLLENGVLKDMLVKRLEPLNKNIIHLEVV